MTEIRESQVETYFCRAVERLHGEVRKVQWIGRRGAPDRFVMMPGSRANFWAEIKRPGGTLEPHQQREIERMQRYGEIVHVVTTYDEADAALLPWASPR
jgi:hypothetical protein